MIYLAHPGPSPLSPQAQRKATEVRRRYKKGDMPLGSYMMGCAAVLVGDIRDEASGGQKRGPIGTSFFVRVESEKANNVHYSYCITCQHVVEDQNHVELQIPTLGDPTKYYPTIDAPDFGHPVKRLDLAIAPFSVPEGYVVTSLQAGFNFTADLDAQGILASPFHYVGYLEPLGLVMARTGSLGRVDEMLPDPLPPDPPKYEYRTHIGDVRSYDGFSGSPCFVEIAVPVLTPEPPLFPRPGDDRPVGRLGFYHLLCGMFTGHIDGRSPKRAVSRHGVGFILSSDEIWDVLMSDDMRQERRDKDELAVPEDVRTRTSIEGSSGNDEMERFTGLLRKVAEVPKSEVDQLREDSERS